MQAKHSYIKSLEKKCPGTEKWCCYANNLTLEAREQVDAVHWPHPSHWVWHRCRVEPWVVHKPCLTYYHLSVQLPHCQTQPQEPHCEAIGQTGL